VTRSGQALVAASVIAAGAVYVAGMFPAIVLRPALPRADARTRRSAMGLVRDPARRRLTQQETC
jgi:hypothetical protein